MWAVSVISGGGGLETHWHADHSRTGSASHYAMLRTAIGLKHCTPGLMLLL